MRYLATKGGRNEATAIAGRRGAQQAMSAAPGAYHDMMARSHCWTMPQIRNVALRRYLVIILVFRRTAAQVVYTDNRAPQETSDAIVSFVRASDEQNE
jgi:hypothetical protein